MDGGAATGGGGVEREEVSEMTTKFMGTVECRGCGGRVFHRRYERVRSPEEYEVYKPLREWINAKCVECGCPHQELTHKDSQNEGA